MKNNAAYKVISRIVLWIAAIIILRKEINIFITLICFVAVFYIPVELINYWTQIDSGETHLENYITMQDFINGKVSADDLRDWDYKNTHMTAQEKLKFQDYRREVERHRNQRR